MSMNGAAVNGADSISSRYVMQSHPTQNMGDRRRRGGGGMNKTGNYYNTGPRGDTRMNSGYRQENRMNSRGTSGGSGDGPHNGTGYRSSGGGSDYDTQPQSMPSSERSSGHLHSQGSHQYHNAQYPSSQSHHHHHHHQKSMDYDPAQPPRQSRGVSGSASGSHHHSHVEHRSNGLHQPHQHHHQQHVHTHNPQHAQQAYVVGGNGGHHTMQGSDIIIVQQPQQDHHYKGGGNMAQMPGHFQAGTNPQQIPAGPAVGFFGYPGGQPSMMGTFMLCHVPIGINPSSVIAPGVYSQVIGCGFINPMVQVACSMPSQFVPSQPVIFQQQPQQHFAHPPTAHFQPVMNVPPPHNPQPASGDDASVMFDSSALLNPDAHAFFPTLTSFSEDVDEEEEVVVDVVPQDEEEPKLDLLKDEDVSKESNSKFEESGSGAGEGSGNVSDIVSEPSLNTNED